MLSYLETHLEESSATPKTAWKSGWSSISVERVSIVCRRRVNSPSWVFTYARQAFPFFMAAFRGKYSLSSRSSVSRSERYSSTTSTLSTLVGTIENITLQSWGHGPQSRNEWLACSARKTRGGRGVIEVEREISLQPLSHAPRPTKLLLTCLRPATRTWVTTLERSFRKGRAILKRYFPN